MPDTLIPIRERIACSVDEAMALTGLGRTTVNALIGDSRIVTRKVGRRRLVIVSSLVNFIEGDA